MSYILMPRFTLEQRKTIAQSVEELRELNTRLETTTPKFTTTVNGPRLQAELSVITDEIKFIYHKYRGSKYCLNEMVTHIRHTFSIPTPCVWVLDLVAAEVSRIRHAESHHPVRHGRPTPEQGVPPFELELFDGGMI